MRLPHNAIRDWWHRPVLDRLDAPVPGDCGCIEILCPHRGLDPDGGPYDVRSQAPERPS